MPFYMPLPPSSPPRQAPQTLQTLQTPPQSTGFSTSQNRVTDSSSPVSPRKNNSEPTLNAVANCSLNRRYPAPPDFPTKYVRPASNQVATSSSAIPQSKPVGSVSNEMANSSPVFPQRRQVTSASDVSPANLLVHLWKMYGPNADWKSREQYTTLRQILKLEGDVIVAIRTAGGKKPIAICLHWVRRLDKMKIPYERFLGAQSSPVLHGKHDLIFVSGDVAKQRRWTWAITELNQSKSPVVRFVVDEAQYYYTDHTFQEALDNPFLLRVFPFQLVLMGATIPHPAEEFLKRQFMVTSPTRISSISDRPELEVRILEPYANMEDLVEGAKDLINTVMKVKQWKPIHRYLVFVHSFADGKCLSQELQGPFYHANTKDHPIDDQVRKKIYTDWINGMNPGLVTTMAITAGNNYDHVMFTMHIGTRFNLVTFEQQRTRAARDGKHGINYVLVTQEPTQSVQVDPTFGDLAGGQVMRDIIYRLNRLPFPESCHMYATTSFIDGKGRTCVDLRREKQCDSCKGHNTVAALEPARIYEMEKNRELIWNPPPHGLKRSLEAVFGPTTEKARKRAGKLTEGRHTELDFFHTLFNVVGQSCGFCFAKNISGNIEHRGWACCNMNKDEYRKLRGKIKYTSIQNKPCFGCQIFSMGQDALHAPFVQGVKTCDHENLVLPMVYAVYSNPKWHEAAKAFFKPEQEKHNWESIEQFASWYSTLNSVWGWPSMAVMKWVGEHVLDLNLEG
ncbi:P-loop containing nucleoside triphosphate hydrolase protein [Mycena sp. CBHHK59/15]|nr:P-loop containing nucleoside triphosphate hydrolase protein [Mycena sp. CBHHK59/15]